VNLDSYALPIKKLKGAEPVESLDLSNKGLSVASAIVIASLIGVDGGLTVTNLLHNSLDAESAKMLAEVAKQKGISLCGIRRDQTTADFSEQNLKPPDTILLASDLSQAVVTGSLTSLELRGNQLGDEGWGAIFAAICGNKDSKIMSMDASDEGIGQTAGVKLIAEALRTSVTGGLMSVELRGNRLEDEDWGAIFAAICGNKDSKIMSMDASDEKIGPAGVKLIAEALRMSVTGALTALDLSSNKLEDGGVSAVCQAIQSNKETKLASLNFQDNDIGPVGANAVAAMVAATGGLTKIE
jgi:hypothetical protein